METERDGCGGMLQQEVAFIPQVANDRTYYRAVPYRLCDRCGDILIDRNADLELEVAGITTRQLKESLPIVVGGGKGKPASTPTVNSLPAVGTAA